MAVLKTLGKDNAPMAVTKIKDGHAPQPRPALTAADGGKIASLGTLRIARWAIFDNDTRLLFAANFNGDVEAYMRDFAEGAPEGIDAIREHCGGCSGARLPEAARPQLPVRAAPPAARGRRFGRARVDRADRGAGGHGRQRRPAARPGAEPRLLLALAQRRGAGAFAGRGRHGGRGGPGPQQRSRRPPRGIPAFVGSRGGEYSSLPGVRGLRHLASDQFAAAVALEPPRPAPETAP